MGSSASFTPAARPGPDTVGMPSLRSFPAIWGSSSPAREGSKLRMSNLMGQVRRERRTPTCWVTCGPCGGPPRPCGHRLARDPLPRPISRNAGSPTRLNKSPKRRPGRPAQLCSFVWISRTRASGAGLRPRRVFRHSSSSSARLCSTLPCGGLSRAPTTTAAPPRPAPIGRRWAQPGDPRWRRGPWREPGRFPCSLIVA